MKSFVDTPHEIGRYNVEFAPPEGRTLASIGLSLREEQALMLFIAGKNVREAALLMGVSPHTVETFKRRIYTKLEVHSMAQAVAIVTAWSAGARVSEVDRDILAAPS